MEVDASLRGRVSVAFQDPDVRAYAADYLAEVRTNWRDDERELRRTAFWIALLAVVFELLVRGGVAEIAIGFVKTTKPKLIEEAIPVAVAFLMNGSAALIIDVFVLGWIHDTVLSLVYEPMWRNNLEYGLYPANTTLFSQKRLFAIVDNPQGVDRLLVLLGFSRLWTLLLLPVGFEIYAYWRLFSVYGGGVIIWISLVLSILLIGSGAVVVLVAILGGRELSLGPPEPPIDVSDGSG